MTQSGQGGGTAAPALPAVAVSRAIDHMNDDHREDMVAIARQLAGLSWATDAEMTGIDAAGCDLRATGGGHDEAFRLNFAAPLADASGLRAAIVALAMRARA